MKKLWLFVTLVAVGSVAFGRPNIVANSATRLGPEADGTQVRGTGIVARILPDDNDGSRHQRFILRLKNGQTLLVAHNVDIAPRVDNLKAGNAVEFNGEYQWNAKGGVVHWTHRDPAGRHVAGWLKHNGRVFQ